MSAVYTAEEYKAKIQAVDEQIATAGDATAIFQESVQNKNRIERNLPALNTTRKNLMREFRRYYPDEASRIVQLVDANWMHTR